MTKLSRHLVTTVDDCRSRLRVRAVGSIRFKQLLDKADVLRRDSIPSENRNDFIVTLFERRNQDSRTSRFGFAPGLSFGFVEQCRYEQQRSQSRCKLA